MLQRMPADNVAEREDSTIGTLQDFRQDIKSHPHRKIRAARNTLEEEAAPAVERSLNRLVLLHKSVSLRGRAIRWRTTAARCLRRSRSRTAEAAIRSGS